LPIKRPLFPESAFGRFSLFKLKPVSLQRLLVNCLIIKIARYTYQNSRAIPMSIFFLPVLFNAQQFESLTTGDIRRRIQSSIVPGVTFSHVLDGYDIGSFRVETEPERPVGSIVDYLYERLPSEATDHPNLVDLVSLLAKLTDKEGNLAEVTDHFYLGYLTAEEVVRLRGYLEQCSFSTLQTLTEISAMVKILAVAGEHQTGLLYAQT
jgi:hypothetical protein